MCEIDLKCRYSAVSWYEEGPTEFRELPIERKVKLMICLKVGAIVLGLVSVVLLSYLGIMMSWGLAFGLPWTLAYFYFIWICPAHQLTMGIRCYDRKQLSNCPFNSQEAETLPNALVGCLHRLPHSVAWHWLGLHHHHLLLLPAYWSCQPPQTCSLPLPHLSNSDDIWGGYL